MLANVKAYIDAEQARKDEAERAKKEKELRKQEQRECEQKEEEERQLKARRAKKKEEKKRSELKARKAMRKGLRMKIKKHVSRVAEEMKEILLQSILTSKGKAQVSSPEASEEELDESDVDALSAQAEHLNIQEKRKRSAEKEIGDSPSMMTQGQTTREAKQTTS
ncbi:hypothetical protein CBR_g51493 [Chara braunii]|uniref:Uncharacterized protein n=1 Tax=Chara braunii TaxID=69332 RepID=A0A388K6D2_CHABU|nr:hypothetical protein CBR_g51493 [Chara braunii]|eukprot:GBG65610.1 hypothetical protein CBR_g51493 [Chara braunii]